MLRTRAPLSSSIATWIPFDLHVLSLPLAFILSQDQTLHCNEKFKNVSKMYFRYLPSRVVTHCCLLIVFASNNSKNFYILWLPLLVALFNLILSLLKPFLRTAFPSQVFLVVGAAKLKLYFIPATKSENIFFVFFNPLEELPDRLFTVIWGCKTKTLFFTCNKILKKFSFSL